MIRGLFLIELRSAAVFQGILLATFLIGGWILERVVTLRGVAAGDATTGVDLTVAILLVLLGFSCGARVNGPDRQARQSFLARLPMSHAVVWGVPVCAELAAAAGMIAVIVAIRPGVATLAGVVEPVFVAIGGLLWIVLFSAGVMWSQVLKRPLLCHVVGFPVTIGSLAVAIAPRSSLVDWRATAVVLDPMLRRFVPGVVAITLAQLALSLWMQSRRDPGRVLPMVRDALAAGIVPLMAVGVLLSGVADRIVGWTLVSWGEDEVAASHDGTKLALLERLRDADYLTRLRVVDTRDGRDDAVYAMPFGASRAKFHWSREGTDVGFVSHQSFGRLDLTDGFRTHLVEGVLGDIALTDDGWILKRTIDAMAQLVEVDPETGLIRELVRPQPREPDRWVLLHGSDTRPPNAAVVVAESRPSERTIGAWVVRDRQAWPVEWDRSNRGKVELVFRGRGYGRGIAAIDAITGGTGLPTGSSQALFFPWGVYEHSPSGEGLYALDGIADEAAVAVLYAWIGSRERWEKVHDRIVLRSPQSRWIQASWGAIETWRGSMVYSRQQEGAGIEIAYFDPVTAWGTVLSIPHNLSIPGREDPAFEPRHVDIRQTDPEGPIFVQIDVSRIESSTPVDRFSHVFVVNPAERRVTEYGRALPIATHRVSGLHDGRVLLVGNGRSAETAGLWAWLDPIQ